MSDIKTALRQARAAMVAEFTLRQKFERIEWEESVLNPKLEELKQEIALHGVLPVIELETDETQD